MGKLKQDKLIVIIIITILVGLFYWFQLRPSLIVKSCNKEAVKKASEIQNGNEAIEIYDARYKSCLRSKGLVK